jgi:predicted aconitase with swiveling domain
MKGRVISPGRAEGDALVSKEPIGFYGEIDAIPYTKLNKFELNYYLS